MRGVSLRSTTCKRMVTVPGGELRCTGNLCSERHSRPEAASSARGLLTIQTACKTSPCFFSRKKKIEIKHHRDSRIFCARSRCNVFSSSSSRWIALSFCNPIKIFISLLLGYTDCAVFIHTRVYKKKQILRNKILLRNFKRFKLLYK